MIIIIGSDEDFHAKYVLENLIEQGHNAKYLDTRDYPLIKWSPERENDYIVLDNEKVYINDVQGLYWRWYYGINYGTSDIVYREKLSALESFLTSIEDISYNSMQAVELHYKKRSSKQNYAK